MIKLLLAVESRGKRDGFAGAIRIGWRMRDVAGVRIRRTPTTLGGNVLLRHFKSTDFLLSTYADTLFGTLSPKRTPSKWMGFVSEAFDR